MGIAWGVHNIPNDNCLWGITLIVVSISLVLPTFLMIVNRRDSNERRGVREVLTAFLAGHQTGLFTNLKNE